MTDTHRARHGPDHIEQTHAALTDRTELLEQLETEAASQEPSQLTLRDIATHPADPQS